MTIVNLQDMFDAQRELQVKAYGKDPSEITDPVERIQFLKDMHMAQVDEMHETLGEMGWKPWAKSRHIDEAAAHGELVDEFHFFMNRCIALNLTPTMLEEKYFEKNARNLDRQMQPGGYDGISGKCTKCRRALDDPGVGCYEDPLHPGFTICVAHMEEG